MKVSKKEYAKLFKAATPNSALGMDMLRAFLVGGTICLLGQIIGDLYVSLGVSKEDSSALVSSTLILIGALLTAFGVYDKIANIGKAGTLVPLTGFPNSIVSPAMEYQTEGLVPGVGTNMFTLAGPVIVYGISASVIYGIILVIAGGI